MEKYGKIMKNTQIGFGQFRKSLWVFSETQGIQILAIDHSLALVEQLCPPDAYLHRSISGLETVCRVPAAFLRWNLWFEPYSNTSGDGLCKLYSCYVPWLCALANWSLGIQSDQCHRPRHPGKSHGAREALVPVLLAPRKKAWWATWIWPHLICI